MMRVKPGRPDITRYADRFDLGVTFLGVATLLLDDDHNAVLTDGFFSRPSLARVALGRIAPDHARIDHALQRAAVERLNAVVPLHSHYDHVLDSPAVAERTGAVVVGGRSAANVARGQGLPAERVLVTGTRRASGRSSSPGWDPSTAHLTATRGRSPPRSSRRRGPARTTCASTGRRPSRPSGPAGSC
jgi:L-ascorbate metabolism protein UlaG (beta-lactamase superfamily)